MLSSYTISQQSYLKELQNIELIQMSSQNNHTPKGFMSLNSSFVNIPNQTHMRTQSYSKLPVQPTHQFTHTRAPSQKKLSLTCQNIPLPTKLVNKDQDGQMKKRGQGYMQKHGNFVSMGSSRIVDNESVYSKAEAQNNYLMEMKKNFEQKFKQLQAKYSHIISDYMVQVRQLQKQLCLNTRHIQLKEQKIQELEEIIRNNKEKIQMMKENSSSVIHKKINDLQIKMRIIAEHIEQNNKDQHCVLQQLTEKIVSYFGNKFSQVKNRSSYCLGISFQRIKELQNEIQQDKIAKRQKHSEGTRGSLESVGSELSIGNKVSHLDSCGVSFYDDCFFYPSEQHTEDYELIVEMVKKRQHPLTCWIDNSGRIRYADTNSFIFNRRGDVVVLPREEIQSLVNQNLMILC